MSILLKKYEKLINELDLPIDKIEDIKHIFQEFMNNYFDYSKAYNEGVLNNATLYNEREMLLRDNKKLNEIIENNKIVHDRLLKQIAILMNFDDKCLEEYKNKILKNIKVDE